MGTTHGGQHSRNNFGCLLKSQGHTTFGALVFLSTAERPRGGLSVALVLEEKAGEVEFLTPSHGQRVFVV